MPFLVETLYSTLWPQANLHSLPYNFIVDFFVRLKLFMSLFKWNKNSTHGTRYHCENYSNLWSKKKSTTFSLNECKTPWLLYIYLVPGSNFLWYTLIVRSLLIKLACEKWELRAVTGFTIMKCKNIVFILHRLNFKHIQFQQTTIRSCLFAQRQKIGRDCV